MENKNDLVTLPFRPLVVTIAALIAVQALLLIPVFGLIREVALRDFEMRSGLSIAAIAFSVWLPAVTMVQIVLLVLPSR